MKNSRLMILLLLAGTSLQVYAGGIVFEHGTWAEVLKKSSETHKPIFVDFYATWCGPCKMMSRDVFTQAEVGAYFNANYISYKVDAEKEEAELVQSIDLTAYPTLVFFSPSGKMIHKQVGAIGGDDLVRVAAEMASLETTRARVLDGKATRDQVISYLAVASEADPETFKNLAPRLVESFTLEELSNENPWKLFTVQVDDLTSPRFQFAIEHASELSKTHDDYTAYVGKVLSKYFEGMATAGNLKGLDIYKQNLQTLFKQISEREFAYGYFDQWVNSDYYLQRHELGLYASSLIAWVDTYLADDWKKLAQNGEALSKHVTDKAHQAKALHWAQQAVKLDRNKESVYLLAKVYENIGQKDKALSTASEILSFELGEEEKGYVQEYIAQLKG